MQQAVLKQNRKITISLEHTRTTTWSRREDVKLSTYQHGLVLLVPLISAKFNTLTRLRPATCPLQLISDITNATRNYLKSFAGPETAVNKAQTGQFERKVSPRDERLPPANYGGLEQTTGREHGVGSFWAINGRIYSPLCNGTKLRISAFFCHIAGVSWAPPCSCRHTTKNVESL